jgi:hypothetical protein
MLLELSDVLIEELTAAAKERNCSIRQFALETLESALAERRLPRIAPRIQREDVHQRRASEDEMPWPPRWDSAGWRGMMQ